MRTPIRLAIWIWGRGIDDFTTFCLPSILQPDNLPWLVRNGYPLVLDFYTVSWSAAVVGRLGEALATQLHALAPDADVSATFYVADAKPSTYDIKIEFLKAVLHRGVETRAPQIFILADMYYGDGSLRTLVTYGQKPGITVSGLYLRVKRERFSELLAHHHAVTGGSSVSNARLVDIAFDSLIEGVRASIADVDRNATYSTSGSLRQITDDLYTFTFHVPTPILCSFEPQDIAFFEQHEWNMYMLDHLWPSMLIAQNRWRVLASSDLLFVAELNAASVENDVHVHETHDGMLYNDEYVHEHLNGRHHQAMLMTFRRERLPETEAAR